MSVLNFRDSMTKEGLEFAHAVSEAMDDIERLEEVLDGYEVKEFLGGSRNRVVCEFPDEFVTERGLYFEDYYHDTFHVLKACDRPNPQNYKEVEIWKRAKEEGIASLFAPVIAWDGAYRWVLMKRVTPISPAEFDTAYTEPIGSGQEFITSPEAIDTIENELGKHGWSVVDADENTAYHEEQEHLCLMDYGGVHPPEEIEYPEWVTA